MAVCGAKVCLLVGALLHLFTNSVALNTHTHKRAASGLRRSSHKLRASAFRAASYFQAKPDGDEDNEDSEEKKEEKKDEAPVVNAAVPPPVTVGLANVTKPTAFPPAPPNLDPWTDNQPLDTNIGHYIISGFIQQPTVSPPPTQETLDLAFACPILLNWPREVAVSTPDKCGSQSSGNWTGVESKDLLISWTTGCVDVNQSAGLIPSSTPVTSYTISNGIGQDFFGSTVERKTPFGSHIEMRDCGGSVIFTVEEKVYKQVGEPHQESCTKYKSCDGVIYLQYFIKNARGEVVAMTGYNHIFQASFDITDPAGVPIAHVSRNGWDPTKTPSSSQCAESPKRDWIIQYEKTAPGMWGSVINQWPIAAMMQMLAVRDETRQPDGQVLMSNCEIGKMAMMAVFAGLAVLLCVVLPCMFVIVFNKNFRNFFTDLEARMLKKRMNVPRIYGN